MSAENECTCFPVDPKYWTTHYGAVDPATTMEPNPDCPEHFPGNKLVNVVISLADLAGKSGLPDTPSGIVLLYPEQAHLVVLLGEHDAEARFDLGQSLQNAAEDLL